MSVPTRTGRIPGNGLDLACSEWGQGREGTLPVVLLHGLAGRAADWTRVAVRIAERRRVVAFDARGHGSSDWARSADYTADAHFADAVTALEELGLGRSILVGYSMGAGVAILIAGAMPERVARLVVVDSYPSPEMTPGSLRIARWVAATYGRLESGKAVAARRRPGFDPAIARSIAEALEAGEARRADLWPLWEGVRCPVLVVRGALSTVLPEYLAQEMVARQPRARLATLEGVGHGIIHSRPEELAELIGRFIEDQPLPETE